MVDPVANSSLGKPGGSVAGASSRRGRKGKPLNAGANVQPRVRSDEPVVIAPPAPVYPDTAAQTAAPAAKDTRMDTINTTTSGADTAGTQAPGAHAMFGDFSERAKAAMARGQQMAEEATTFGKGNVEALVESSKIAARGLEAIGHDAAAFAKSTYEEAVAASKTLASVKSPTEFMKLQSDYVRSAFDSLVAVSSRNAETMLKLAGEVAQPLSNRVALAAEKVKVAA